MCTRPVTRPENMPPPSKCSVPSPNWSYHQVYKYFTLHETGILSLLKLAVPLGLYLNCRCPSNSKFLTAHEVHVEEARWLLKCLQLYLILDTLYHFNLINSRSFQDEELCTILQSVTNRVFGPCLSCKLLNVQAF